MVEWLSNYPSFPDVKEADLEGLLAVGGDLSPQRLLLAYRQGIFPWYSANEPILWWSPDPRAIIPLNDFRINRTMQKILKRGSFEIKVNAAFEEVINACADRESNSKSGWITKDMISAYINLYQMGFAHSVEAWKDGKLAGGLYGVAICGVFAGESMFHKESNASKVALCALVKRMKARAYMLLDCQMVTDVTRKMGALEISRADYLKRLDVALMVNCSFV